MDYLTCDIACRDRDGAIKELVETLAKYNKISNEQVADIVAAVIRREGLGSTVISDTVAIPHCKCEVDRTLGVVGKSNEGVFFEDKPIFVLLLLVSPSGEPGEHLRELARLSLFARSNDFNARLSAKELNDVMASQWKNKDISLVATRGRS